MIYIGLTGWGDHDSIYPPFLANRDKLKEYAAHFPIVELDASFYAIQPESNMKKWVEDTPSSFQFIVKAYQGMTGHQRKEIPFDDKKEMFAAFQTSLQPLVKSGKLAMVLFQFPPWFDCRKKHVDVLRYCREQMREIPVALEFRHRSWFSPRFYEKTLSFMEKENWIHSICDEPQIGDGSIPTVLHPTDQNVTLVRFHGRNKQGWLRPAEGNWREVRYLYRYNKQELIIWSKKLRLLEQQCKKIYVLFNNNSGGDAADNAKEMMNLLNIEYQGLAPKQLDIFDT